MPNSDPFGKLSHARVGLWLFLLTDTMTYAGLLLACAVLRARTSMWSVPPSLMGWGLPFLITLFLLISVVTMSWRRRVVTLGCGLVAVALQIWQGHLAWQAGLNLFTSSFLILTAFHALHVVIGVLWMLLEDSLSRFYWQFVVLSWIPVASFLYFDRWLTLSLVQLGVLLGVGRILRNQSRTLRWVSALPLIMILYALALWGEVKSHPHLGAEAIAAPEPAPAPAPVPKASQGAADEWR